ncbi:MAG TPA: hypothetical protein VFY28_01305 [Candidatus Paceibacterota bacterium]|nr:hypothetical protein [Candidatus Paceibacterota bacterium]
MAQAFVAYGDITAGIEDARTYGAQALGLPAGSSPDVILLTYGLFPVEDARRVGETIAHAPLLHERTLTIIAAERIYHEAQNALLKLFEEPPAHAVLVLVVPAEGQLLSTLRSRLAPLPRSRTQGARRTHPFLAAAPLEREKMVAKLLDRARSGGDEDKQAARAEAIRLVEDLIRAVYALEESEERALLLRELDRFLPILHERSAPLKLIFEHLLLVLPKNLVR